MSDEIAQIRHRGGAPDCETCGGWPGDHYDSVRHRDLCRSCAREQSARDQAADDADDMDAELEPYDAPLDIEDQ